MKYSDSCFDRRQLEHCTHSEREENAKKKRIPVHHEENAVADLPGLKVRRVGRNGCHRDHTVPHLTYHVTMRPPSPPLILMPARTRCVLQYCNTAITIQDYYTQQIVPWVDRRFLQ